MCHWMMLPAKRHERFVIAWSLVVRACWTVTSRNGAGFTDDKTPPSFLVLHGRVDAGARHLLEVSSALAGVTTFGRCPHLGLGLGAERDSTTRPRFTPKGMPTSGVLAPSFSGMPSNRLTATTSAQRRGFFFRGQHRGHGLSPFGKILPWRRRHCNFILSQSREANTLVVSL